jgi:hypothetical protein
LQKDFLLPYRKKEGPRDGVAKSDTQILAFSLHAPFSATMKRSHSDYAPRVVAVTSTLK